MNQKLCHSFRYLFQWGFLILVTLGCDSLDRVQDTAVARVGDSFLYRSDIILHFGSFTTKSDSAVQVQNYVNTWAKEQLLYQQAEMNIDAKVKKELQSLVQQYEVELYGQVYKESLVNLRMDTLVLPEQIQQVYDNSKSIFKLKEPLYQYRLLGLPLDNVDRGEISMRFRRFDSIDRQFLDSLSFQFSTYHPWDSLWTRRKEILQDIDFINEDNLDRYFKNPNYFEVKDSLDVYLFVTNNRRDAAERAPVSYVESTLKNLILNRRKIEFLRNFDNEILQDAIRSKKYEIYVE